MGYWLYTATRNSIHSGASTALAHGLEVHRLEQRLGLDFELSLNRWVAAPSLIAQTMDYYYATLHFGVTIGVLIWLFRCRRELYRGLRTVLLATTGIGMLGFYLFPLAPPRLLPALGYTDTLVRYRTWGSLADPKVAEHSNQFAAMPSLHVAWALWCGLALYLGATRNWVQVLGLCYPAVTFLVVIGTGNHFVLDTIGGAATLALGVGFQVVRSGHHTSADRSVPTYSVA